MVSNIRNLELLEDWTFEPNEKSCFPQRMATHNKTICIVIFNLPVLLLEVPSIDRQSNFVSVSAHRIMGSCVPVVRVSLLCDTSFLDGPRILAPMDIKGASGAIALHNEAEIRHLPASK